MENDVSLKVRLLQPTNKKVRALSAMQEQYTKALSLLVEKAKELDTASRGRLHREAYHQVKGEVSLPSESLRVALNQTCHITRSWKARRKRGVEERIAGHQEASANRGGHSRIPDRSGWR